ncbi:MAG: hypothetical protein ACQ9CV_02540, partial [Nitrosopumilus sp.]
NSYEAQIDDVFEVNYDGTNKGNGDGKGKFGAWPGKSGEAPGQEVRKSNGKSCSTDKGLNGPLSDLVILIGQVFSIEGYTATGNSCKDATSQIQFTVVAPNNTSLFTASPNALTSLDQPETFNPDTNGDWIVKFRVQGFTEDRTLEVKDGPTLSIVNGSFGISDAIPLTGSCDSNCGTADSWLWEITDSPVGPPPSLTNDDQPNATLDANREGVHVLRLTYTNTDGYYKVETHSITVVAP